MKHFLVGILLCAPFISQVWSQDSETAEVEQLLYDFFDHMRGADSASLGKMFHPRARMLRANFHQGESFLSVDSVNGFLKAIGTPHKFVYDERIWNIDIHIDQNLASAWMNFAFYLGDQFSHCGVNNFTFFKSEEGWKILQIADTSSKDCDIPEDIRKN